MTAHTDRPLRLNWIMAGDGLAGGTKSNRLIAEAMARRGHDVRMFVPTKKKKKGGLLARLRGALRGGDTPAPAAPPDGHLTRGRIPIHRVDAPAVDASDVPDADVVLFSWWEVAERVFTWPRDKGVPVHYVRHHELHGGDPDRVRRVFAHPGPKIAISNWLVRVMRDEYGHDDVTLVHNGVDREQFFAEPREKTDPPVVGFLYGRQKWKGADTAAEACRIAQKSMPSLRVVSFGSKPWPDDIPKPANFTFEHRPAQGRIAEIYRGCDCWIVPSTTEGLGMPGLEAAACRCPLVITRSGGPEDYCKEGVNGHVVGVGDADAMARAVLDVASADAARWRAMSDASAEIARGFDWDASAEILEQALRRAVGG